MPSVERNAKGADTGRTVVSSISNHQLIVVGTVGSNELSDNSGNIHYMDVLIRQPVASGDKYRSSVTS